MPAGEVPFKIQWVHAYAVSSVGILENQVYGHGVNRVLESTLQKTRPVGFRQHPAVAQPEVPDALDRAAAGNRVAPGSP